MIKDFLFFHSNALKANQATTFIATGSCTSMKSEWSHPDNIELQLTFNGIDRRNDPSSISSVIESLLKYCAENNIDFETELAAAKKARQSIKKSPPD